MTKKAEKATSGQIAKITGLEDDGFITAILRLGPTAAEVRQAFQCMDDGECSLLSLNSNVQRICEILEAQRELNDLSERL